MTQKDYLYQRDTEWLYLPTWHRKVVFSNMIKKGLFINVTHTVCSLEHDIDSMIERLSLPMWHRKGLVANLTQKGCIYQHDRERLHLPTWHRKASFIKTLFRKGVFTILTKKGCIYQHDTEESYLPTWYRQIDFTNSTQKDFPYQPDTKGCL